MYKDNNFLAKQTKSIKEPQYNHYWTLFFFKCLLFAGPKAIDLGLPLRTCRGSIQSAPAINLCLKGRPIIIHTLLYSLLAAPVFFAFHHFPLQIMRTVGPAVKGYLQQISQRRESRANSSSVNWPQLQATWTNAFNNPAETLDVVVGLWRRQTMDAAQQ